MANRTAVPNRTERDYNRFASKVIPLENGCHAWAGGSYKKGYSLFTIYGFNFRAHRVIYVWTYGEPNADLHHTCDNRWCVNPEHVTPAAAGQPRHRNAIEGLCKNGHPFDGVNSRGDRICSICRNAYSRDWREEHRDEVNARKRAVRVPVVYEPRKCALPGCDVVFTPKRSTGIYCDERDCINERQRLNRLGKLGR